MGYKLSSQAETNYLINKIRKRLGHWTLRSLALPGRAIYLRHVLRAVPIYHLMIMTLTGKGCSELESITRWFLWGSNKQGANKKALISWNTITCQQGDGGLGITTFREQGMALKMRHVACIITEVHTDWIKVANTLISAALRKGPHRKERTGWTPAEALVLLKDLRIRGAMNLRQLLDGWWKCRQILRYNFDTSQLPKHLPISKLAALYGGTSDRAEADLPRLLSFLTQRKVHNLQDFRTIEGNWKPEDRIINMARGTRVTADEEFKRFYSCLIQVEDLDELPLQVCRGWKWEDNPKPGWHFPNRIWVSRLGKIEMDVNKLNRKWQVQNTRQDWERLWKQLWGGWTFPKVRFFMWKLIHHGFFTNSKALKWGVADGICPRCRVERETLNHLFFECIHVKPRWTLLGRITRGSKFIELQVDDPLTLITNAIRKQKRQPGRVILLMEICNSFWQERNQANFHNSRSKIPIRTILANTHFHLDTMIVSVTSRRKHQCLITTQMELMTLMQLQGVGSTADDDN